MAADDVPDARRHALLGRHLLPAGVPLRPPGFQGRPARDPRPLCPRPGEDRLERRGDLRPSAAQPRGGGDREPPGGAGSLPRRHAPPLGDGRRERRPRRRPEIPQRLHVGSPLARLGPRPRSRHAASGDRLDPGALPRRHIRPPRRRPAPLRGRRPLARPAFREDALRQRAVRPRADRLPGRHVGPAFPPAARGDGGLLADGHARPGRRLPFEHRRRQRRGGGSILRLVAQRDRRRPRPPRARLPQGLRRIAGGQLGGQDHPQPSLGRSRAS